ncbi:MAG: leucyl aminopeptidase [Candidatus Lambdaproteobacteria bacterium]|nr:leucyl aminopeptidase [Candidatus Lambdaproteobacteria bacterium]
MGALAVFVSDERNAVPTALSAGLRRDIKRVMDLKEFSGKAGQSRLLFPADGKPQRLLLVGLGKAKALTREALRRAAGSAAGQLADFNLSLAGAVLPKTGGGVPAGDVAGVVAEGMALGAYRFNTYKAKAEDEKSRQHLQRITLFDPQQVSSRAAMQQGMVRAEAMCLARTLGNQPANAMTPTQLAKEAATVAKRRGLKFKALERKQLEAMGMGLFMGVAKGSRQPPKLILLEYRPRGATRTLAIVGKGITFDSGGISLKPGANMDEMKFDMCGAAAVLGAMDAIGALKPRVNVIGVVPACENLPDGEALKPGDILRAYSGTHVEILNTDAEGRLILADALAYAVKTYKPDGIVDLATLTGACVIALGHYATGAIANDEAFQAQVVASGKSSGDTVWPLPNFPEYEELIKGKYADLQNVGAREGGAITAGLFLKHFVGETPWVHLDIAGTAWGVKNVGHVPNEGATGVGVGLLIDLARQWGDKR